MKWLLEKLGYVPIEALLQEQRECDLYATALCDIISMQTPGANATVKRMVRRAEEALN